MPATPEPPRTPVHLEPAPAIRESPEMCGLTRTLREETEGGIPWGLTASPDECNMLALYSLGLRSKPATIYLRVRDGKLGKGRDHQLEHL